MESKQKPFPAKAVFWTAAALALCIGLFAGLASRASRCTPEQFKKAALPIEGQAYVTLYVKNNRVNLQSGKSHPTWGYSLYLREDHGVGFQIESLRIVYSLDNGQTVGTDYSASDIARMKQTSHLNGYGLIVLAPGYTPSDQSPAHPTGAGILLEGRDDGGRRLTFTHYIPLDPYALKGLNPQDNLTGNVTLSMHNLGIYTPESGLFIPSEYKDVTTYVLGWYKAGKLIAIELLNESVSFKDTWPRLHRRQPEPVRTQLGRRSRAGYFFPPADGRQQPRAAAFVCRRRSEPFHLPAPSQKESRITRALPWVVSYTKPPFFLVSAQKFVQLPYSLTRPFLPLCNIISVGIVFFKSLCYHFTRSRHLTSQTI